MMTFAFVFFMTFGASFWFHGSKKTEVFRRNYDYYFGTPRDVAITSLLIAPAFFALRADGWANGVLTYFLGLLLVFLLKIILDWGYEILDKTEANKRWKWIVVWFILFGGAYVVHLMTGLQYTICILGELGAYILFEKALSMFKKKKRS